jgi:phosphatidylglycerol---prolipoprotein diacylglyceryl transferase
MYPRLLHIYGPLWIHTYGVMIALGFLTFLFLTTRHPLRKKFISTENYLNLVSIGLASGVIGGRLLYVLTNLELFANNWMQIFYPWVGGFTVIGAICGVLIVAPFKLHSLGVPILPILDLATLYAPLMQAIARLGCLGAGCCYGAPAPTLWWAITFTNPCGEAPLNTLLHPAQLYTSLASLLIFFMLMKFSQRLFKHPGTMLCAYLALENTARFITDFWRGDREPLVTSFFDGIITISQVQCFSLAGLVITGILVLILQRKKITQSPS